MPKESETAVLTGGVSAATWRKKTLWKLEKPSAPGEEISTEEAVPITAKREVGQAGARVAERIVVP